ncbi:MAG: hypothetical protein AB8E15_05520 [Bdellovibrionales bacterium]
MSVSCPKCTEPVDVDFGMAQCDSCSNVFFVNVDGSVQADVVEAKPMEASNSIELETPNLENNKEESISWESSTDNSEINMGGLENDFGSPSISLGEPEENDTPFVEPEEEGSIAGNDPGEATWDFEDMKSDEEIDPPITDFNDEEPSWEMESEDLSPPDEPGNNLNASDHLKEITDYGNSEVSQAREGVFYYSLKIIGADTAEIRRDIREIISDRKFLIDVDATMKSESDGEIQIEKLNAIKASLIINQLRVLPINISWKQNAINI